MEINEISYTRLKRLLIVGLILLIVGFFIKERHVIGVGIGFTITDLILIYYKKKTLK
ncbi:hypothetical protein [Methanosphaera sp.]